MKLFIEKLKPSKHATIDQLQVVVDIAIASKNQTDNSLLLFRSFVTRYY